MPNPKDLKIKVWVAGSLYTQCSAFWSSGTINSDSSLFLWNCENQWLLQLAQIRRLCNFVFALEVLWTTGTFDLLTDCIYISRINPAAAHFFFLFKQKAYKWRNRKEKESIIIKNKIIKHLSLHRLSVISTWVEFSRTCTFMVLTFTKEAEGNFVFQRWYLRFRQAE